MKTCGGWKPFTMGWGWTLKLANGLSCTVRKSMTRGEGFIVTVFGVSVEKKFDDENEAKRCAERNARRLLETAINNLPNS